MKNNIRKSGQWCFQLCLFVALLVPGAIGLSAASSVPTVAVVGCLEPGNLSRTGITSSSISFSWSGASGATGYQVYYLRMSDNTVSSVMTTGSTSMTISGLSPGAYRFYFATVCEEGTSDYIIMDDLIIL